MKQVDVETAKTSPLLCTREQIKRGFWTEPNRNASMPYRSTTWEETCYRNGNEYYESNWSVDGPCELTAWDPSLLCELLENKTLGFLGDSISWQTFRSMVRSFKTNSTQYWLSRDDSSLLLILEISPWSHPNRQ